MTDVCALGELLIDFAPHGVNAYGYPILSANPGGAPGNLLAALSCFGCGTAMIGKVGDDAFGRLLIETLKEAGIDTFGTLSLTDEPAASATRRALEIAREAGCLISLDPNLRKPLWKSEAAAKEAIEWSLRQADIVKISDEEIDFLWGLEPEAGARKLLAEYGVRLVYATLGPKGCHAASASGAAVAVESPKGIHVADTTGAGDIFGGSAMSRFLKIGRAPEALTEADLREIVSFACAAASLSTQIQGGITSVPALDAVLAILSL